MQSVFSATAAALDSAAASALLPLACWILLSGLDDLFVLAVYVFYARNPRPPPPTQADLETLPRKRIAVFVPLWQEHPVIRQMLEHNIAALRYEPYEFFVGAYTNDELTLEAVEQAAARFPIVHLCRCPHDGPTSKADCLNWIYQHMLLHEERHGIRFDVIVTHDAEDIIHPDSFRWINYYMDHCGMVQTPVLAMPTPWREFTHGLYCDDFAEFHGKDMMVRQALGGFIPSSGVGTGFNRDALEKLANSESNRVFEPGSLTEDYEIGFRLQRLNIRQLFAPIRLDKGKVMATREFFPRSHGAALRQRTRWVTGIALQSWQKNGWRAGWRQIYWLWRDRKGLVGNPASFLSNLMFGYGALTWAWSRLAGQAWRLGEIAVAPHTRRLLMATLVLGIVHMTARMCLSARIYGWLFAMSAPLRQTYGNWLNSRASLTATLRFAAARIRRRPLVWVKTEHAYPSRMALMQHKRLLGEVLVDCGFLCFEELQEALLSMTPGVRLGEHLLAIGMLSEAQLYRALSIQQSLPIESVNPRQVRPGVARALPARVVREWKVLPFRVAEGSLFLASPDLPSEELQEELRRFTHLEIRFHLVTPSNFKELEKVLL